MSNESQQIAALTCIDIDILAKVAEEKQWTAEQLREFIFQLKYQKDLLVTDAKVRESRYNATATVFNLPRE